MSWKSTNMNNLQIFENSEFGSIRTVLIDGEPWFVGKDVAVALGYKDTADALKKHVDSEDKLTRQFADSGQNREMYIINESGMYALIFGSKLESAKRFKHWVTSEVLPSIRKTGTYSMVEPEEPEPIVQDGITIQNCLEAARIMASVPDSQRYVINILRHCFPDIDAVRNEIQKAVKVPAQSGQVTIDGIRNSRLRREMENQNLSPKDIAERTGISITTVKRYMKDGHKGRTDYRDALAITLGKDKDFLKPSRRRTRDER